jgi:tRNA(fMet)-specific endonuclease VapC
LTKYILDTNVVSALMKGDERVVARLRAVPKESVSIPHPVIAEVALGIERLPKSKKRAFLEQRFDLIRSELHRIEWNDSVSERFGSTKASLEKRGKRIEDFDAAIAAHVPEGGVLVTANLAHMTRIPGLKVEDWSN